MPENGEAIVTGDTGSVAVDFGVTTVPESYLVAPTGIVVDKLIGGVTADQIDARIKSAGGRRRGQW